jgi:hypothetical protein
MRKKLAVLVAVCGAFSHSQRLRFRLQSSTRKRVSAVRS